MELHGWLFKVEAFEEKRIMKVLASKLPEEEQTEEDAEENKENDIFISKFELSAANALEATEAATCALTFITPQGTYFDDNDLDSDVRTLQAQIRIKGNAIDNDSQLVKYYWFVENNNISMI